MDVRSIGVDWLR